MYSSRQSDSLDIPFILSDYQEWVEKDFILDFRRLTFDVGVSARSEVGKGLVLYGRSDGVKSESFSVVSSKRGNAVYSRRLMRRIARLQGVVPDRKFFRLSDRYVRGSWLWCSFEFDANRFSVEDSWLLISGCWNRFKSWLVKRFGRICFWVFRQAHPSVGRLFGYCHFHVIIQFLEREFSGFRHVDRKTGRLSFRIDEKDLLASNWSVGFVDVKMVQSVQAVLSYGARYGSRALSRGKADLTLALGWKFKRRGFSMSRVWSRISRGVDVIVKSSNLNWSGVGLPRVVVEGSVDPSRLVIVVYSLVNYERLAIVDGDG